jgi:hypothetical protein
VPLKSDLVQELCEHHSLLQSLSKMSGRSTCSDTFTHQRTMEQIEFIKRELAARDNLMHQMSREREEFRQQLALIRGGMMNVEQTISESSSFPSRRLSQQGQLSEMQSRSSSLTSDLPEGDIISTSKLSSVFPELLLTAMSASKSVPVASCIQAMPAVTVPACASMSVSLGVPVNIVNTSKQIGGVTST